jgi:transposase InsO family protein
MEDRRCKLGLAGRLELVQRVERGASLRPAAAALNVAPATARRWWHRWQAGALLHIDAFELPKFARPGHWATGQRAERHKTRNAGRVKVIGVIDDHTRLAYCELHAKENAVAVSATLRRAVRWFGEQGCGPVQAVMSDNAKCYTGHAFRATVDQLATRQILIPPYTPRWNGKICVLGLGGRPVGRRGSLRPVV